MLSLSTVQNSQARPQVHRTNDRVISRYPVLDNNARIWITLVVLIPIIITITLCVITSCIYRYRKKRSAQNKILIDQHGAAGTTMFHGSKSNPFVIEELPPSYELISETKTDLSFIPETKKTDLPSNQNEMITIVPPPPYNSNSIYPNKSLNEN